MSENAVDHGWMHLNHRQTVQFADPVSSGLGPGSQQALPAAIGDLWLHP